MKRSSFLQTLACAVALSAMDVMGLVPAKAPGEPKALVETLWQRVRFMNDGTPYWNYCVSDKRPDLLSQDELLKGMEEGERLAKSTIIHKVTWERSIPLTDKDVCTWEDLKP